LLEIDYLLLNFLFILVSVLFYFSLGFHKWKRLSVGVVSSACVIFCMSFPFTVFPGYTYDLRTLPFLLAVIYGGALPGTLVCAVLLLYQYLLGGDAFLASSAVYIPVLLVSAALTSRAKSFLRHYVVPAATILAMATSFAVSTISWWQIGLPRYEILSFFIYYSMVVSLCMWMTAYVIETMRENILMRDEIQRSEKMQVLGELASTIAHEIRNPMTVAKGFVQLLRTRVTDETGERYSALALEELNRAESIISDYLMYAKPQPGVIECIHVGDKLRNIMNLMEPFVRANGHDLEFDADETIYVQGDSKKFSQVLVNIAKNAVEAMEYGGKLTMRAHREGRKAIIEIADTGVGMTDEQMQRLGNPFYSTKERGTGLGLMVSYRIIQAMSGEIKVHSARGKGTKFSIVLPCAEPTEGGAPPLQTGSDAKRA